MKFWQFELIQSAESKAKVLSVLHTRSLKLEECVLCVKVSPNSRLIAVSLLDSTVKVFYLDTLKVCQDNTATIHLLSSVCKCCNNSCLYLSVLFVPLWT